MDGGREAMSPNSIPRWSRLTHRWPPSMSRVPWAWALSELPWASHSEVSGKTRGKKRETGGTENLRLREAGAAVMGEGLGGLKDRWQSARGASDHPSFTLVRPRHRLCPVARSLRAVCFHERGSPQRLPGAGWVGEPNKVRPPDRRWPQVLTDQLSPLRYPCGLPPLLSTRVLPSRMIQTLLTEKPRPASKGSGSLVSAAGVSPGEKDLDIEDPPFHGGL